MAVKMRPLTERFWPKVKKTETCWLFTGAIDPKTGYGRIGRGARNQGVVGAHQVSYEIHYGAIPEGKEVCHHCDNRACVRPEHLFAGTRLENVHDSIEKGRKPRGERCSYSKLTEDDVSIIRTTYIPYKVSQYQLAQRFGVSRGAVSRIIKNQTWFREAYDDDKLLKKLVG